MALGRAPSPQLGPVDYLECADGKAVVAAVDAGGIDLCVLDGEAWPTGGLGLARQLTDEIADRPATVVLVGRRDDRWLAAWSRADAVVAHPIDPFELTAAVARLLAERAARAPVPATKPRFGLRHG